MSDLNRRAAEAMGWHVTASVHKLPEMEPVGWSIWDENWRVLFPHAEDFDPCNRIEHAWMLVEWLVKDDWHVEVTSTKDGCEVILLNMKANVWMIKRADTAPLAITRAFLEAVG